MNKYKVILADCPWHYKVWHVPTGSGRSAESHYPTMDLTWLKKLNVSVLADKDSVLLLWATWPCLLDALSLGEAWGFKYKTCGFLWSKVNKKANTDFVGMGYYTRANTEPCLLFSRGRGLKRKSKAVRQLIQSRIRRHSQKPDEIYGRIEQLFDGPYLELFARQRWPNWDGWGNEFMIETPQDYLVDATILDTLWKEQNNA